MSEQLHEDEYTPKIEQRSLYGEQQLSHELDRLSMFQLQEKFHEYVNSMSDPDVMPHHKAIYRELTDMLIFEIDWRVKNNILR